MERRDGTGTWRRGGGCDEWMGISKERTERRGYEGKGMKSFEDFEWKKDQVRVYSCGFNGLWGVCWIGERS